MGQRHQPEAEHKVSGTGAIGHSSGAEDAVGPGHGVSGESHGWLVAQRVERQDGGLLDDCKKRQRKAAGDTEYLMDTSLLECVKQSFRDIHLASMNEYVGTAASRRVPCPVRSAK